MINIHRIKIFIKASMFIGVFIFSISCENDIKEVIEISSRQDSALLSAENVELIYSTMGIYKARMEAPLLLRFMKDKDKSELEFPKGIKIYFYNEQGDSVSSLRADYSIYYEYKGIWEARNDVEVINIKGEKLNTEFLVWDKEKAKIWSNEFVKITTDEGILYGDGFESDQEFNSWEIKKGRGVFNVDKNE